MDFFTRQDRARKQTGFLLVYFGLAVMLTILLVYIIPVTGLHVWKIMVSVYGRHIRFVWWYPNLFIWISSITITLVMGGAAYKIAQLRQGGGRGVAGLLGGSEIVPSTDDFFEQRLRNIVEEMAIASGVPVPPVYVMKHEKGINAFAAGFSHQDAVIAVTYGAMTCLSRDELQGVIAHEFSHILNRDMMLNIRLMGFLHGLIIIGLTGRILITEVAVNDSYEGRAGNSAQMVILIVSAGFIFMVVGFTGYFFCKLIKASISRSRERLADASAVQFTRNPMGLAGALKKIGGLSYGSRIRSRLAEQASHMFFGNALSDHLFSTHPPLVARVKWLDPSFDGNFKPVTVEELGTLLTNQEGAPAIEEPKASLVDLFTKPVAAAAAAAALEPRSRPLARPNNPEALLESIGRPMEHHAYAAKNLIGVIPERVKEYARDPFGARMLIYWLLLDARPEIRDKQLALVTAMAEPTVNRFMGKAVLELEPLKPEWRLPLVDLSIPALRFLSITQYASFRRIVQALIEADHKIDIFEYALQRVLLHHLDPLFREHSKPGFTNYYALRGLERETSIVLSVLARKGNAFGVSAVAAFTAGADALAPLQVSLDLLDEEECGWSNLDAALNKLNEGSFKLKKWVLGALLICLMQDREITVDEVELFRAIADTLGCPVPPWVAPTRLDES